MRQRGAKTRSRTRGRGRSRTVQATASPENSISDLAFDVRPRDKVRIKHDELPARWQPLLAESTTTQSRKESLCVMKLLEAVADSKAPELMGPKVRLLLLD